MTEKISVIEFLLETKDDVNSPTTSTFTSKMSLCRATIAALEESLDADRSALKKMKNSTKALHASGQAHVGNEGTFATNLERLGNAALHADESDIGSAFLKFTVFSKELTSLLKNLIANINNVLTFPLEALLKGDLKGIKGDMKRPFDKSWKDYDSKVKQVEREKRQLAKEAGMIRSEITGAEIAEEMEKERRMFQLQVCEYLIKANEIKTKKGVELVQHLIDFYHAQNTFFTDGLKVIEQYRIYAEGLTANLNSLRQTQDEEHRQLVELRSMLKASVSDNDNTPTTAKNQNVYNLHQLQGNKDLGNEKSGYLLKRSEGLRRAWQKRRCVVTGGFLTMSHNNANKPPVKLNLLTSQLKLVPEDKKQFDLVSHNRTYRFMADDEGAAVVWVSVISNSKEDALNQVFGDATCGKNGSEENAGLRELTQSVISEVQRMPGNEICCDCSAPNPTWLSTNLGVLLCIECSGIHREMGVHVSRIQSITLDDLGTAELILAHSIGNENFNDIMEVKLELSMKPDPSSDMEERKSFIRGKYISRHYVTHTCGDDQDALADELKIAIHSCEISSLLQLFAEGADLLAPLPGYFQEEAALHAAVAVTGSDGSSSVVLPLVDFLAQNLGQGLNQKTSTGNTALHICAELNKTECMKLLLRSKAKTDLVNNNGDTALAIAKQNNHLACVELLEQAASGKFTPMVYVDVDWNLTFDDDEFVSDDELDDRPGPYNQNQGFGVSPHKATPENHRPRPVSFKEKPRPSIDQSAPLLPPRTNPANPPAIPPHQGALSRNRSLTVQPMSNLAEHTSRRTSTDPMPPPLPVKPALPAKTIHHAATNNLNQSPFMSAALQDQQKRNQPPDPKTADPVTPKNPPKLVAQPRISRPKPSPTPNSSAHTPKRPKSSGNNIFSSKNKSANQRARPVSESSNELVIARNALRPRASFAMKHNLPTEESSVISPSSRTAAASFTTFHNNELPSPVQSKYPDLKPKPILKSRSSEDILTQKSPQPSHTKSLSSSGSSDGFLSTQNPRKIHQENPPIPNLAATFTPYNPSALRHPFTARNSFSPAYLQSNSNQRKDDDLAFKERLVGFSNSPTWNTLKPAPKNLHPDDAEKTRSLPRNVLPPGGDPPEVLPRTPDPPVPLPRASVPSATRPKRVRAIYDCEADNNDELTFVENEIIIVTGVEDQDWWVGHVEHQPHRTGVFPVSFVHILTD